MNDQVSVRRPTHRGKIHDRAGFSCGEENLDRYLKTQAGQDVRRKANAVFVLSRHAYSVITRSVRWRSARARSRNRSKASSELSTRQLHAYRPLGRGERSSRSAAGSTLLADALRRAYASASTVGSSMVIVDALNEAAADFYAAHGFVRLPDSLRLVLPMRLAGLEPER